MHLGGAHRRRRPASAARSARPARSPRPSCPTTSSGCWPRATWTSATRARRFAAWARRVAPRRSCDDRHRSRPYCGESDPRRETGLRDLRATRAPASSATSAPAASRRSATDGAPVEIGPPAGAATGPHGDFGDGAPVASLDGRHRHRAPGRHDDPRRATWSSSTPATTSPRPSAPATRRRHARRSRGRTVLPLQSVAEQDVEYGRGCTTATPTCAARCARSSRWQRALRRLRRLGHRAAPRRVADPRADTPVVDWDAKRADGQGQPARRLDARRRRRLHRRARGARSTRCSSDGYASIGCAPVHPAGHAR